MTGRKLKEYAWPGNVRELQHAMERAVILCTGSTVTPADLMLSAKGKNRGSIPGTLNLETLERQAVQQALAQCGGNISRAAELLGITRFALYRKMEKYGL